MVKNPDRRDEGKWTELAAVARRKDLDRELGRLADLFVRWREGSLDGEALAEEIRIFTRVELNELDKLYGSSNPLESIVAGIRRGVLDPDALPMGEIGPILVRGLGHSARGSKQPAEGRRKKAKGTPARKSRQVFQLKVTLLGIKPPIWRRIQVDDTSTFWDLHVAIQDSMGWLDCHLHLFQVSEREGGEPSVFGIPSPDGDDFDDIQPGWEHSIAPFFAEGKRTRVHYEYDFGDGWGHTVELEKVLDRVPRARYPKCLGGKRACPPEDCGGPLGYGDLLDILADPEDERHGEMLEWVGGHFDPEAFSVKDVSFSDPEERLDYLTEC